jgi:hypothetical protein
MAKSKTAPKKDTPPVPNDAYTGILIVSLVALLAGGALVYLDYSRHSPKDPPKVDRSYQPSYPGQNGDTSRTPDPATPKQ